MYSLWHEHRIHPTCSPHQKQKMFEILLVFWKESFIKALWSKMKIKCDIVLKDIFFHLATFQVCIFFLPNSIKLTLNPCLKTYSHWTWIESLHFPNSIGIACTFSASWWRQRELCIRIVQPVIINFKKEIRSMLQLSVRPQ